MTSKLPPLARSVLVGTTGYRAGDRPPLFHARKITNPNNWEGGVVPDFDNTAEPRDAADGVNNGDVANAQRTALGGFTAGQGQPEVPDTPTPPPPPLTPAEAAEQQGVQTDAEDTDTPAPEEPVEDTPDAEQDPVNDEKQAGEVAGSTDRDAEPSTAPEPAGADKPATPRSLNRAKASRTAIRTTK